LVVAAEVLPSFNYPPPVLDFTDGIPSELELPGATGGSFPLIDADIDIEPCCLTDFFSLHQNLGELQDFSGKKVVLQMIPF
jgi:hypothetical protein